MCDIIFLTLVTPTQIIYSLGLGTESEQRSAGTASTVESPAGTGEPGEDSSVPWSPVEWPAHTPRALRRLGEACLAVDPARRPPFRAIAHVLRRLEAAARREGVQQQTQAAVAGQPLL
jgi:hypothetical protein